MNERHDDIFVVLNIGSSYLSGMLATKSPQGRVLPLAAHRLPTAGCVRQGCIHNIEDASRYISSIIDKLKESLPEEALIQGVYVGLEPRSMRSVRYESRLTLKPEGCVITAEHLDLLRDQVKDASYPGMKILSVTDPRYRCDGQREATPRGVRCHHIEAEYLLIIARQNIIVNLQDTIEERLGLKILGFLPTPIAEATAILTMEERVLGCAYVNIGGGTTSIAIYRERYPEALFVLPLGGNNITRDLTKLPIRLLESDAERLKVDQGSMDLSVSRTASIDTTPSAGGAVKRFSQLEVNRFISFRVLEILNNVVQIIREAGYEDALAKGFIFAGGVTKTKHFYETLRKLSPEYRAASLRRDIYEEGTSEHYLTEYMTEIALAYQAKKSGVVYELRSLEDLLSEQPTPAPNSKDSSAASIPEEPASNYETENYTYPESHEVPQDLEDESEEDDDTPQPKRDRKSIAERAKGMFHNFGKNLNELLGGSHDPDY